MGAQNHLPFDQAVAVTPSDSTILRTTDSLYVGTTGNVAVEMANTTTTVVFVGAIAGEELRIRVRRVLDTNTTASDIVALYHR